MSDPSRLFRGVDGYRLLRSNLVTATVNIVQGRLTGRVAQHSRYSAGRICSRIAGDGSETSRSMRRYSLCSSSCCCSVAAVLRDKRSL